ncbi:hypothetical protein BG32_14840 [Mesotoga sp. HF07.pep.5.2.highcov]|nr:hypothetical protein Y696_09445 [Mesotoga sp. H07pep.5.4]RLL92650.1 hypothetical protein BG32_14840 [Mesotoga sp. HF07.pep.5.2.highcov]
MLTRKREQKKGLTGSYGLIFRALWPVKDQTIPKKVRDDRVRDFQKVMTGMIAYVISKTP